MITKFGRHVSIAKTHKREPVTFSHLFTVCTLLCALVASVPERCWATEPDFLGKAEPVLADQLRRSGSIDVMVRFEDSDIDAEIEGEKARKGLSIDDNDTLQIRIASNRQRWNDIEATLPAGISILKIYHSLPFAYIRIRDVGHLESLVLHPRVTRVQLPRTYTIQADQTLGGSLSAVQQPSAAAAGFTGEGAAVVVLDTGVDASYAAFSDCPSGSCLIAKEFAPADGAVDGSELHGTRVSAIVHKVAPKARVIVGDVVREDGVTAYDPDVIEGIDWAITNKYAYGIAAINLSIAGGRGYTSDCDDSPNINTFSRDAVNRAVWAGIAVVVAVGNGGQANHIAEPACYRSSTRVASGYGFSATGADYPGWFAVTGKSIVETLRSGECDAQGSVTLEAANESTVYDCHCTQAIVKGGYNCQSNAKQFTNPGNRGVDLIAPGYRINVLGDGIAVTGTSFAAPFVSGAMALVATTLEYRGLLPSDWQDRLKFTSTLYQHRATRRVWYKNTSYDTAYDYTINYLNIGAAVSGLTLPPSPPPSQETTAWLVPVLRLILY